MLFRRHKSARIAASLLIAAGLLMPTFAWAVLDVIPVFTGIALLVVGRRQASAVTATTISGYRSDKDQPFQHS